MTVIARYRELAQDMERAARRAEQDDLNHPVTRFDAMRWADTVRALGNQHRAVDEATQHKAEAYRLRAIMTEAASRDPVTCRKWIKDALATGGGQ